MRLNGDEAALPKPLVRIGEIPILVHIMNIYRKFGFNDFIIACGYKQDMIISYFKENQSDFRVECIDTGLDTATAGRIKKLAPYLGDKEFMLTYGDGVSNIDMNELLKFHNKHKKQ